MKMLKISKSSTRKTILLIFSFILLVTVYSFFNSLLLIRGQGPRIKVIEDDDKSKLLTKTKEKIIVINNCSSTLLSHKDGDFNKTTQNTTETKEEVSIDYLKKYPQFLNCKNSYNEWKKGTKIEPPDQQFNFSVPADKKFHDTRFIRGILIYFPITSIDHFKYELKWLYRSWIHMIKYEPLKWRTDLIVFIENDTVKFNSSELFFMKEMNCRFENKRKSAEDKPMCTLIDYVALKKRNLNTPNRVFANDDEKYRYLLKDVNIFKTDNSSEFDTYYKFLKESIGNYGYLDSILMAFEGYEYFKSAGYDYLVRSDMDVFLAPLFATWLPRHCNDFNVGGGAFSHDFNEKRISRATYRIGLKYAFNRNLGSTWYSTPDQFRLVSYLTLFGMAYLASEEFSQVEREGKIGVMNWPEWHYGVLLLYGQSLALNHLIATDQAHVVRIANQLDYPSGNTNSIHNILNIHVFHGDGMFSKFAFKVGKYDQMNTTDSDEVKYYCLKMALDGKRMSGIELNNLLVNQTSNKI